MAVVLASVAFAGSASSAAAHGGSASSYHAAPPPVPFEAHIDWLGTFSPANHHR